MNGQEFVDGATITPKGTVSEDGTRRWEFFNEAANASIDVDATTEEAARVEARTGWELTHPSGPPKIPPSAVRAQILADAQGLITETFPRKYASNMEQIAGRTVHSTAVALLEGDHVTNLALICPLGGNNVTEAMAALTDKNGTVLLRTADFAARLANPVAGSGLIDDIVFDYSVTESGVYYVSYRQVGDAYVATALVSDTDASSAAVNGGNRAWGEMLDQDAIPDTVTIGAPVAGPIWFGLVRASVTP